MQNMKELLAQLQEKIGNRITNEGLLRQAVTHSSFANEQKINKLSK